MTVREALTHPWLTVRVQIALGAIFIIAALPKIVDPPAFAQMTYNYKLLPGALVNISALMMPWVELLCGVALVVGLWKRSATAIITALLVIFIIAISINLARGNAIDCGCFGGGPPKSVEERLYDMKVVIVRDIAMLVMCAQLFWAWATRERVAGAAVEGTLEGTL